MLATVLGFDPCDLDKPLRDHELRTSLGVTGPSRMSASVSVLVMGLVYTPPKELSDLTV